MPRAGNYRGTDWELPHTQSLIQYNNLTMLQEHVQLRMSSGRVVIDLRHLAFMIGLPRETQTRKTKEISKARANREFSQTRGKCYEIAQMKCCTKD
jgi:hypothetical protein